MNIVFDSDPIYGDNDKYIKTKGKKVPKENESHKCLSIIVLDSVIRVNKVYYPQIVVPTKTANI